MFAKPTIDDFLALIDWHIGKADDRAKRAVNDVRRQAAAKGALNSGRAVMLSFEAVRTEFDSGIETVLGELKRVMRITTLDRDQLRQHAVQRLMNFAIAAKIIAQTPEAASLGLQKYVDQQLAAFDQHLRFAVRQFEVGFHEPAEPEVPNVDNSIKIGIMTGSAIQQGSPGAKQSVEFTLSVEAANNALTVFESALVGAATLPTKAVDDLTADIRTIRAQLVEPSPSGVIIQEAGKSMRNVIEGIVGGMLTPAIASAAAALWSVLGIG
jgi:hypothetical protein